MRAKGPNPGVCLDEARGPLRMEEAHDPERNATKETSAAAIASFVLGLLSLTTCFAIPIFPPLAIVLGSAEKEGLGRAGFILGWIGVAIYAMVAIVLVLFLLVGGASLSLGSL